jgi:hypothetical protein
MNYEERKIAILKSLATYDNLGRVLRSKGISDYAALREKFSFDDFFWLVKDLHQHFLIDVIISDDELGKHPDDPLVGTIQIRQEGIEFLKNSH